MCQVAPSIPPNSPTPDSPVLLLAPHGWRVPLQAGQSLMESAERAGVRLVRSCRNGTCRRCLCRMTAGEVSYRIDWPGVSAEERAEGWVLPCVAVASRDVTLLVPDATRPLAG